MDNSHKQRIQNQFGGFCVRVLKNEANRIFNEYAKLRSHEASLDTCIKENALPQSAADRYFCNEHTLYAFGMPVVVMGDLLSEALCGLTERNRCIILMHYFLGMSDRKISRFFCVSHQAISKQRIKALKEMKKLLEGKGF